jgi:hypothetical protein
MSVSPWRAAFFIYETSHQHKRPGISSSFKFIYVPSQQGHPPVGQQEFSFGHLLVPPAHDTSIPKPVRSRALEAGLKSVVTAAAKLASKGRKAVKQIVRTIVGYRFGC